MEWERHRFHANEDDYRPVIWPPLGPYWCSGYGDDYSIVIAYLPKGQNLLDYWPEADNVDTEDRNEITFSDRFPCPKWWDANTETVIN